MDVITDHVRRIISEIICNDISFIVGDDAEKQCCGRFAAKEIIHILCNTDIPPLIVLESFRDKMDDYSERNNKTAYIFVSGREIAEHIINVLT